MRVYVSIAVGSLLVAALGAGCAAETEEFGVPDLPVADASQSDPSPDGAPAPPAEEPLLEAPAPLQIDEEAEATIALRAAGIRRFDVDGLPPGARFDDAKAAIVFRPDFTQSGVYRIDVTGHGGTSAAPFLKTVRVELTVRDTVAPPQPTIAKSTVVDGGTRLVVRQVTDAFLDSPGKAGRAIEAAVFVPSAATPSARLPVVIGLHGFGGAPNATIVSKTAFRIEPHDPDATYWWGYAASLPSAPATQGAVPPYTLRRVLHLLAWVLRTQPGADPDRAFAVGGSMGGAGAFGLGLLHARHFAGVESQIAQAIPRNHRPSRVKQLTGLWGSPEANLDGTWDAQDVTRIVRDVPEARDQFVFTKHGKDDGTIHFGAVVTRSALTQRTLYEALAREHVGHYVVWDEGGHGPVDPVLGAAWWDSGWSRITDKKSFLSRNHAFPAFSGSSADGDPGDGTGNGKVAFSPERGYAAQVAVGGDTGWAGDLAGVHNRYLRWDTKSIVDTHERFAMAIHHVASSAAPGSAPPKAGYPPKGDRADLATIMVDVTPRRLQAFRIAPGERVRWIYGASGGTVTAASDGSVTIPKLSVGVTPMSLSLERELAEPP